MKNFNSLPAEEKMKIYKKIKRIDTALEKLDNEFDFGETEDFFDEMVTKLWDFKGVLRTQIYNN